MSEPNYQFLIKKYGNAGIRHSNDANAFIECSNTMDNVYEHIDGYNRGRKRNILIAEIMSNKKFQAVVRELFIRCRKLNISLVFITQSYFSVPKDVRLNSTHYLIMKIKNKNKLKNITINHSADIKYKDFVETDRECIKEPFSFLTTASDLLGFRKSLFLSYKKDSN